MLTFSERYDQLEQDVIQSLRSQIENSTYTSVHTGENAIKVNIFDYTELSIINGDLTFLDEDGLYYNLYADCSLEDLIDINFNSKKVQLKAIVFQSVKN
jgi:hypothetical protein